MIIKDIENTEEITIEDKTYIKINLLLFEYYF